MVYLCREINVEIANILLCSPFLLTYFLFILHNTVGNLLIVCYVHRYLYMLCKCTENVNNKKTSHLVFKCKLIKEQNNVETGS